MIVNTAGAAEFVIYREEKIGLTFTNIFIHTRILLKYIYRGHISIQIHGYREKKDETNCIGKHFEKPCLCDCAGKGHPAIPFAPHKRSPACPRSGVRLFHRQAAHWMAKDRGPCGASRVRAGLWEADTSSAALGAFWLWPAPFFRIPKIALIKSSRLAGNTLLHVVTATVPARLLPQSVS